MADNSAENVVYCTSKSISEEMITEQEMIGKVPSRTKAQRTRV